MSRTVDERVVSMQFDNRHFEQNVKTTMSTLDKLKKSLNFPGVAKGFENISASAKKCDLSPVSNGVENARSHFSAFEVMAVTALANITNSAVNAGKRIVKALTLEPVKMGFNEYEIKMGSIQTIIAGTGESLATVNRYLNELNEYSDKTIYSFQDMTSNIGKFTNAGVKLEDAVAAIKGISNEAAVSGATAAQASHAMYNLAQALSSGYVKLIDWKSIENAQMATMEFKQELIDTAVAMGTVKKTSNGMYQTMAKKPKLFDAAKGFNDTLQDQWMTSEVLIETLKRYADETTEIGAKATEAATKVKTFTQLFDTLKESAQSGWAQTWEIIVGDFEEARDFLTGLSDLFGGIIGHFSDARNKLLGDALNSNWEKLTDVLSDAGIEIDTFHSNLEKVVGTAKFKGLIQEFGSVEKAARNGKFTMAELKAAITGVGTETKNALTFLDLAEKVKGNRFFYSMGGLGKAGDDIKRIQTALNQLGYEVSPDGTFGKATYQAVMAFQRASNIRIDGIVGEETIAALEAAVGSTGELETNVKNVSGEYDELLENITKKSGRELLLEGLVNVVKTVIDAFKIFGQSWKKAIDPIITSTGLYNAIKSFSDFAAGLRLIDDETKKFTKRGEQLMRIFDGIVAVLDVFMTVTGGLVKMGIKALANALGMVNIDIMELAARVGDALVAFRDWFESNNMFAKGIEYTAKAIVFTITAVRNLITAILRMPAVQSALQTVSVEFNNCISGIREYLSGGLERIKTFIETVKTMDSLTLDDLEKLLINFKENVIDYFFDIDALYERFVTAFQNVRESIAENLQNAGEKIDWLKDKVVVLAKYIKDKLPAAIAIGMGVMLVRAAGKIGDALELLTSPLELVKEIGDALKRISSAYAFKTVSQGVMNLAIAVGILAASVAVLTFVDQKKLWSVVGALVALSAVLAALAGAVALIEKFGDMGKSSTAIVMLAGSLLLIAASLKVMDEIDPEKAQKSMLIIGALAVTLATVAGILGKYVPTLSSGSIVFLAIAGAIKVMVDALVQLDNTEFNNIGKTLTVMLGIILSLGLIAKACGNITFGSAVGIIAVAIGLKMMIGVIEDIGNIDAGKLTNNIESLVIVFGAFAALMIASRFAGANAAKAGIGILAISAAMLLIIQAMKEMGKLDSGTISKATDAISQLLIVFGAIVALSYFAGENAIKAGAMLLMVSGAMVILAGVIHLIKDIPGVDLAKAVGAIAVLEALFGGLIYISKYGTIPKGTTLLLIELTAIIGVLALIIVGLSKLDPVSAITAAGSMSILLATFAGTLAVIGKNKALTLAEIGKVALSLGALTGVVALLAQIIGALASSNPNGVLTIVTGLSVLLLAMVASLTIISSNPVMTVAALAKASAALLALTGIVALLAQIIGALAKCEPKGTLEIAASLSILLLSMSAACVILGAVGAVVGPAMAGIGVLATLVVAMGTLMLAIGALAEYYPGMMDFLDNGIVMLEKIGTGIGSFVGGIIGGALGSMSSGLPAIARNLSDFMDELQPFIDGVANIKEESTRGAKTLAETILILTAADVLSGLTSWFTGGKTSLVEFGKEIAKFGPYMSEYAASMTGVDASVIESSANAAQALAKLSKNLPSTGGKWQEWFGSKNIATFGAQLTKFGECLAGYSKTITAEGGLDVDAITGSADAARGLADIAANLPSTGGKWQEWFGGKNIAVFGAQLKQFGQAIVEYSTAITADGGIDAKAIAKSADAATGLSNIAKNLPSTGGKWQEWFGGKSLSTFGTQLVSFGDALSKYSKSISGEKSLDTAAIEASVTASKSLAKLANNLPSYHIFDGKSSPTEFGAEIANFGKSLSNYSSSVSGMNIDKLTQSITQSNNLISMIKNMSGIDTSATSVFVSSLTTLSQSSVDGFVNAFLNAGSRAKAAVSTFLSSAVAGATGKNDQFTAAGKGAMESLIKGFRSSGEGVSNVANSTITSVLTRIKTRNAEFNSSGQALMTNFVAGIKSKDSAVSSAATNILASALAKIRAKNSDFSSAGKDLMTSLSTGIKGQDSAVSSAALTPISSAVEKVKAKSADFLAAGKVLMEKLAKGITDNSADVSTAASDVASAAADKVGTKTQYDNFYQAGRYLVQGFAAGITAETWRAEAKAKAMADKAYDAAMEALDAHSPSRVFMKVGSYVAEGFALGISDNAKYSTSAASTMAASTIETVKNSIARIASMIDGDIDVNPTIRPVLDLTEVEAGAGRLQALFSHRQAIAVSTGIQQSNRVESPTDAAMAKSGNTYQFTQNNYSPKALTRDEIYRQTKNQFSAMERMVEA